MARVRAHKPTNVLVIGGGLTSAQIADRAIRQGVTRVLHLMRGPMKGVLDDLIDIMYHKC